MKTQLLKLVLAAVLLTQFVNCSFKQDKKIKNSDTSQSTESLTASPSLRIQYSPSLHEERNLITKSPTEYNSEYFITVPEISDIKEDYENKLDNPDDYERVVFLVKIPTETELRVTTAVKLEYKDGFKDLGGILEELEKEQGFSSYRIAVPRFQSKIRYLPNEARLLRISIFNGTNEQKIFIPLRTASVISMQENNLFEIEKLKHNDIQDKLPYFVLPVKKYNLYNPSDENLRFITESKVSGVLYRYIDEETNKLATCDFITSGSTRTSRNAATHTDIKTYKFPKESYFVLGTENEAKSTLVERAFSKQNSSLITELKTQDSMDYVLYILIPKNSSDIYSIGSCGAIRTKTLPISCRATHCEQYQCTWISEPGQCWNDFGCNKNGCDWKWEPGCPERSNHGGNEPPPRLEMEPRTCRKCTDGVHWEIEKFGNVTENANVLGYGIELSNPFKTTTIQTAKVPTQITHSKAAKITEINTSITLTGKIDTNFKEEMFLPEQCKLECRLNPNDPSCN